LAGRDVGAHPVFEDEEEPELPRRFGGGGEFAGERGQCTRLDPTFAFEE